MRVAVRSDESQMLMDFVETTGSSVKTSRLDGETVELVVKGIGELRFRLKGEWAREAERQLKEQRR